MLILADIVQRIKNFELKASLSTLKDISPEILLNEVIQAYLLAQKNYNTAQDEKESPSYVGTIMKSIKQPIGFDASEGITYQDDIITVRLRSVFSVERVTGIAESVKGIL